MAREKICGIYCIENLINGKKYIGQSIDIYKRWNKHLSMAKNGAGSILYDAIRKDGVDTFRFYILEQCDVDCLSDLEIKYISKYNSKLPNGYNMTDGGGGTIGYIFTEKDRRKISEAGKGRKGVQLCGENNPMYGKHHSIKSKELMRQKALGREVSQETREKLSNAGKGRKHSKESKLKMSECQYKTVCCEDVKFKGIEECAEYYHINASTMKSWLNKSNKMPVDFYLKSLRYEDIPLSEYMIKKFYFCNNMIFETIDKISTYTRMSYTSLYNMLFGLTKKNDLFLKYNIHIGTKEEIDDFMDKNITIVLHS